MTFEIGSRVFYACKGKYGTIDGFYIAVGGPAAGVHFDDDPKNVCHGLLLEELTIVQEGR